MRTGSVALVLLLGAMARAGDPPQTIDLGTPPTWKPDEVVTASVMESTQTKLSGGRSGDDSIPSLDLSSRLDAKLVQRCLEADPQGRLLRSLVRIDEWSMRLAGRNDRCLEGAVVEVTPAGWSLVAVPSNPSRAARGWLDTRFGAAGRGFSGGLAEFGAPRPVSVAESWTADPPAIAGGMAGGAASGHAGARKWKFTLTELGRSPAGVTARVAFDETIPLSGETSFGGRTIRVAKGSSVHVHGECSGVPGQWHRSGRMGTVAETDLDTSQGGMTIRLHIVSEERETWDGGGTAPQLPGSRSGVIPLAIGAAEKWSVGDTILETATERRSVVATPVEDDGKDGAAEREVRTVTWSAEVECVESDSDHRPQALTVILRDWTATEGEEKDASLTGAVLHVSRGGVRISAGGTSATPLAKDWLRAHYGGGVRRDDALRTAMTPVMLVVPGQSWTSDPDETASAVRSRFEYPLDADGVRGKATLAGVRGSGAAVSPSIAYEVEAAISCAPGCDGSGADVMKGTIRVKGTADGPADRWTRLGSMQDAAEVSVTLPGQGPGEQLRRLVITEERRVARTSLSAENRSVLSWTQSAIAKIDRRDFDGAIADCTAAIGLDAACASAWLNRARARAGKLDARGAIEDYTKAVEIDPDLSGAWNNRGRLKRSLGDVDGAIADYSKAIEASPENALAWRNRGLARAGKGDFEGAIADYDRAIEIRPEYAEAWNDRGLAHFNRKEYAAAAYDYSEAAELAPKEALYVVNRGNARSAQGDVAGALADYDAAIALDPSNARAFYFRADLRGRQGDAKSALADYDRAIEIDPKFAPYWNDRGILRHDQGDIDGALSDLTKAIELDPRDTNAWFNRARSKSARGDLDGAIADCTRAVEIDPRYAAAWHRRAGYREDAGDIDEAIADWTHAVEADPSYGAAHRSLARARFLPGLATAPVVGGLRKAIELSEDQDYDRLWLWLARARSGEEPEATKELLDYAARREPAGPDDWYAALVGLLSGTRSEDEVIAGAKTADAKTSAERLCEATFYAGMIRSIRGDVAKAVELLDRCIASGVRNFTEFGEARRWRPALLLGGSTRAVAGSAERIVVQPDPRGPLALAGLRDGDRITGIDGNPLKARQWDELLLVERPGTLLHLDVTGAGGPRRADVTLGAWKPQ